jgi:hypothetical protein
VTKTQAKKGTRLLLSAPEDRAREAKLGDSWDERWASYAACNKRSKSEFKKVKARR